MAEITPSQTVGPYFAYGLTPRGKYAWKDTFGADLVTPVALAAAAAGADGLLVEVHPDPAQAKSDGYQSLNFKQFDTLMTKLPKLLAALDRKLAV